MVERRRGGRFGSAGVAPVAARPQSMVAAGRPVDVRDPAEVAALRRHPNWQRSCWDVYDTVGEVKYAVGFFLAGCMSRLNLFVGVRPERPDANPEPILRPGSDAGMDAGVQDDDEGKVVSDAEAELVLDTLERIAAADGGHGDMLGELAVNLTVPGECYLYGRVEDGQEVWDVRSNDEVSVVDGKIRVIDEPVGTPDTRKGREVTPEEFLIRIWRRHPRYSKQPDSPLRGVLSSAEEILLAEQAVRASFRSRMSAGLLLLPEELDPSPLSGATGEQPSQGKIDKLMQDIVQMMLTPVQDEGDPSALVPMLLKGKADWIEKVRHVTFGRELDGMIEQRTERALKRLAQGLNVPMEVVTGLGDVNHWTAWQIEESTFKAHLAPLATLIVNALTVGYLHPALKAAGVKDPSRFVVWFDPTLLLARPVAPESVKLALENDLIGDAAGRQSLGFGDRDAPTDDELARRQERRRALQRRVRGDEPEDDPEEREAPEGDGPDDAAVLSLVSASRVPADLGSRLMLIDRDLRTRLHAACDAQMRRTLERVGASLRSKAERNTATREAVSGVDNERVAATLGPSMVRTLGFAEAEQIAGAFDGLRDRFDRWVEAAGRSGLALVPGLTEDRRAELEAQLAELRGQAWSWLRQALETLALERLYGPDGQQGPGESDSSSLVPFGVVREAVARAGGAEGAPLLADGGLSLVGMVLGLVTGWLFKGVFAEYGVATQAWRWVYGPFPRDNPFEPHLRLDGETFQRFDDALLRNAGTFPPEPYFIPGDHAGCVAAGTVVEAPGLVAQTLRWYEGVMIDLSTASGQNLTITPNHPVLTDRGWVPAGQLVEGDNLIRCIDPHGAAGLVPHDDERPARVEDLFAACWKRPGMMAGAVPVAAEDFHGDGLGGEVTVVLADGDLMTNGHSAFTKPRGHVTFGVTAGLGEALARARSPFEGLSAIGPAPLGAEGELGQPTTLLRSALGGEQELRLSTAAWRDSGASEAQVDRSPVHAVALGQSIDGLTGFVQRDKLVGVNRLSGFSGHVFNLHTSMNWYVADTIIVHNCVCDTEPIMADLEVALAASAAEGAT